MIIKKNTNSKQTSVKKYTSAKSHTYFFITTKTHIEEFSALYIKIIHKMMYQKRCNPDKKFVTHKSFIIFLNSMISYLKIKIHFFSDL